MIPFRAFGALALVGSIITVTKSRPAPDAPPETMFRGGPAHPGVYHGGGPALLGLAWRRAGFRGSSRREHLRGRRGDRREALAP